MLATKQLSNNVIKIISDSNCYIIEGKYIIDTSREGLKSELIEAIEKYVSLNNIEKVLFTHLHYDHIGCFDIFPNAEFYANQTAINAMQNKQDKNNIILNPKTCENFNVNLKNIEKDKDILCLFKIWNTPGHNSSCIILYYKKDNILFTGDMYFAPGRYGRIDLPTSEPEKMPNSIKVTLEIIKKYKPIICSGHDY